MDVRSFPAGWEHFARRAPVPQVFSVGRICLQAACQAGGGTGWSRSGGYSNRGLSRENTAVFREHGCFCTGRTTSQLTATETKLDR